MDQIRLTGIRATGKHGVLDFEHERAQTFVVDATLFLDLAAAGRSDDLNDTVDYGAVAKGIVAIIEGEHVDLIEKLANRIVGMILGFPAVCRTQVTVHKPNAPITVPFDDVSVTVERSRETVDSPSRERSSEHGQVHHAIIAMGGNQGDVTATLRDAVRCIDGLPSTQVTGVSPILSEPEVNGSKPTMVLNRVDLPTPFGPITPTMPLRGRVKLKSSMSTRSPNALWICSASSTVEPRRGPAGIWISEKSSFLLLRASCSIWS